MFHHSEFGGENICFLLKKNNRLIMWFFFRIFLFIQDSPKYSVACANRHLSFPTSCDIQQKFMVPKYFC